jgi:hypothetical protein
VFIDNQVTSNSGSGAVFTDGGNNVGPSNKSVKGLISIKRSLFKQNQGAEVGGTLLLWGYPLDTIELLSNVFDSNQVSIMTPKVEPPESNHAIS